MNKERLQTFVVRLPPLHVRFLREKGNASAFVREAVAEKLRREFSIERLLRNHSHSEADYSAEKGKMWVGTRPERQATDPRQNKH